MGALGQVVVVGGSLAGLRAVEALRRRGFGGRIVWVGAEEHPPYDRPPLSKQLLSGAWEAERLFFRRAEGYGELEADLRFGRRAVRLDAVARSIDLDDGTAVHFDGLVIATGAKPRQLRTAGGIGVGQSARSAAPAHQQVGGVHTLRTLDDSLAIRSALERSPRVVVIGAGFIGLEVAACCRQRGLDVTIIEALDVPLGAAIGPTMGAAVAALHRDAGVRLLCGVRVTGLKSDKNVEAVVLEDGRSISADLVVVGVGVEPEVTWLQGSGLTLDDGVVCDETCATNVENVVAAGDVARWRHRLFQQSLRVEHWTNAVEQANAAVARLLDGSAAPFATVPYFWSDQYDVKIQFAGLATGADEVRVVEGSAEERRLVALYGARGVLRAALTFNRPAQLIKYRRMIGDGVNLDEAARG